MKNIRKQKKKDKRNEIKNTSIYITGLPQDVSFDEAKSFFSRGGIIKIDPNTLMPKIKLYVDEENKFSGNALVTYKFEQSIDIALKYLNDTEIRPGYKINIEKAVFNNSIKANKVDKGDMIKRRKQIQAAEMEEERLLSWSNEQCLNNSNIASRIVILRPMYSKEDAELYLESDSFYKELEDEVRDEIVKYCDVVNVTCIPRHPQGIVCVKLKTQSDAENIIDIFNSRYFDGRQIEAFIYDGNTDFKASCI